MDIEETSVFALLQQGMSDRQAYAIALLVSLSAETFAAFEQYAKDELKAQDEAIDYAAKVKTLEALRPHWAQGHTDDSVAAQASTAALSQLWGMLKVESQTDAVHCLQALLDYGAQGRRLEAAKDDASRLRFPDTTGQ